MLPPNNGQSPPQVMGSNLTAEDLNRFRQYLAQLTPEQLKTLLGGSVYDEKMGMAAGDEATGRADAFHEAPAGYRAGGTYIAASPLEHLASGMRRYFGAKQMKDASARQNELLQGKQDYLKVILDMLRMGGSGGSTGTPPATAGYGEFVRKPWEA